MHGLKPTHASPLPLKRRGLRRAKARFCQMAGPVEIAATLRGIFASHLTAPYVSLVRSVQLLAPDVAILRAIVGMVPPGQADLNPAVNAHQTLVAVKRDGQWRVQLFQNTPAQFHGRPELVRQMSADLQKVLDAQV